MAPSLWQPPADPPPDPFAVAAESALADAENATRLYLSAQAALQRAKAINKEITLALALLDLPVPPEGKG
jgi:hypothetical protein